MSEEQKEPTIVELAAQYAAITKQVEAAKAIVAGKERMTVSLEYPRESGMYEIATLAKQKLDPLLPDIFKQLLKERTELMLRIRALLRQAEDAPERSSHLRPVE